MEKSASKVVTAAAIETETGSGKNLFRCGNFGLGENSRTEAGIKIIHQAQVRSGRHAKTKSQPRDSADQTRLWVSVGKEQGVVPIDFVNSVAGETGLPGKVVGTVDVRERHSFVDVASEHANGIIAKLNRAEIKGIKVKVKVA